METETKNLSYFSRLASLQKHYAEGERLLKKNEEMWDQILEEESGNPIKLTLLADKIDSTRIMMRKLKEMIGEIKLILSN